MINDYENLNSLIQHLNGLQISSIFFEGKPKITESFKSTLVKNNITIAPYSTTINNYVMLSKIHEKNFNETINKVSSLLDEGKYISLPIVLESEYETRDDLLKSLIMNSKANISIRVTEKLNYNGINWIMVNRKKPIAIIVSGNSNTGKTILANSFEQSNLKIITGDSILEQISKRITHASDEMFKAVSLGYSEWDWSLSIKEINKTPELRQEFAQIIGKISGNNNVIFEMWMPNDLLADVKSYFIQKKFYTWSTIRIKSIEEDLNFKILKLEECLNNFRLQIKENEMYLKRMELSKSWRWTKPLRNFKTGFVYVTWKLFGGGD